MQVQFTSQQKCAVYHITMLMMMIDGHLSVEEGNYWKKVGTLLNMSDSEKMDAAKMDRNHAMSILRTMPASNKIAAIKIFTNMMEADGKVDSREQDLLIRLFNDLDCEGAANSVGMLAFKSIINSFAE